MVSIPVAMFALKVLPGEIVHGDDAEEVLPYRITMAAIEPDTASGNPRSATLKLLRRPLSMDDSDDDESDSDDDDDVAVDMDNLSQEDKELLKSEIKRLAEEEMDEEDEDEEDDGEEEPSTNGKLETSGPKAAGPTGRKPASKKQSSNTGKSNNVDSDEQDDEENDDGDDDDEEDDIEEFVLCSLGANQLQQPLDITVGDHDEVFFQAVGNTPIYLTGNYLIQPGEDDDDYDSEDEDDEYDLSPDEEELDANGDLYDEDESDELDDIEEGKIQEIAHESTLPAGMKRGMADSDEDDEPTLDDMIAQAEETQPEKKLTKKQKKKLKANNGSAVGAPTDSAAAAVAEVDKNEKSVKFAKKLEQGPTGASGPKKLDGGVTVEDKKLGKGKKIKSGDKIGVRYIGKLENGKVFDSNKSGKPFRLTLGKGEVIKGWDIGLTGMSLEGERLITIPPAVGYGKKGTPGIPGNSTLKFEVKLVEVK